DAAPRDRARARERHQPDLQRQAGDHPHGERRRDPGHLQRPAPGHARAGGAGRGEDVHLPVALRYPLRMPPNSAPAYDALVARMAALQKRLKRRRLTVASAESCTGGLLGAVLTENSGSSDHYLGGSVVYANEAKTVLADVPPQLIAGHGAVSSVV